MARSGFAVSESEECDESVRAREQLLLRTEDVVIALARPLWKRMNMDTDRDAVRIAICEVVGSTVVWAFNTLAGRSQPWTSGDLMMAMEEHLPEIASKHKMEVTQIAILVAYTFDALLDDSALQNGILDLWIGGGHQARITSDRGKLYVWA